MRDISDMTYKWARIAGNNDYSHDDHDAGSVERRNRQRMTMIMTLSSILFIQ